MSQSRSAGGADGARGDRTPRMSRGALVARVAVAAAAALALTVVVWPEDDTHGGHGGRVDPKPGASSSPAQIYPISSPPRTIPSVRQHEPARGPGFRPVAGTRVVVPSGSEALADEAQLLAGELDKEYVQGAAPRPGDIELALDPKAKATPESYTLAARERTVRITGPDEAGVFYGTRTLKQALRDGGVMPEGVVEDWPDRPQRGLNLDIARKPFTAGWIEGRLREMADLKLNQLGLHFSDDQGFRIESSSHPEVVSRDHLSKREVERIVALARRLHIEVVPEIDSPGHLGAVIKAHPALGLRGASGRTVPGAVDIANPDAARIVDDLLREYADLFPGAYWHLGGDEYLALTAKDPAAAYPGLAAAARAKYGPKAGIADLATGWLNDRAAVLRPYGKKFKAWNDGYFKGTSVAPDPAREVEYWTGKELGARPPEEYLGEGRRTVNLNDEYLYYVLGEPNAFKYPTGRRIYQEWTPLVLRGTKPVAARYSDQVLGARFAVWCDYAGAQTQDQVARGIRMPLRALAQKLWDPRTPALDWEEFKELADKLG